MRYVTLQVHSETIGIPILNPVSELDSSESDSRYSG